MTVAQNIAYPLRKRGVPPAARAELIRRVSALVGLPELLDRRPGQLSGGQQQRVALARALVYEPPVLLLDEPLSNLDAALRGQLRRELRRLHERLGTTTVLVTHDQEEAAALADTIAIMHQGRIIQADGAANILERPRTRVAAEFVGFDVFLAGRVVAVAGERVALTLASGRGFEVLAGKSPPDIGAEVVVAARSDSLRLCRADGGDRGGSLRGTLHRIARMGRTTEWEIAVEDQIVLVREAGNDSPDAALGTQVEIDFMRARAAILAPGERGEIV
jgi:ABC-type Fe3+/spermidine/putrescine transport system ATPase subunit